MLEKFKRVIQEEDENLSRIIEAIIFLFFFFSFTSFFSFDLTFIPIEEKLVKYRSGVNVLP